MMSKKWHGIAVVALICLVVGIPALARDNNPESLEKLKALERIMVLDGSAVHNVGNLQMNVTNWGVFGSYPSSNMDMAESPSAQWPARGAAYRSCRRPPMRPNSDRRSIR
jgi:hypothetical protein